MIGERRWSHGSNGSTKSCTSNVGQLDPREIEWDKHLISLLVDTTMSISISKSKHPLTCKITWLLCREFHVEYLEGEIYMEIYIPIHKFSFYV
jgi:hypothetical protein